MPTLLSVFGRYVGSERGGASKLVSRLIPTPLRQDLLRECDSALVSGPLQPYMDETGISNSYGGVATLPKHTSALALAIIDAEKITFYTYCWVPSLWTEFWLRCGDADEQWTKKENHIAWFTSLCCAD